MATRTCDHREVRFVVTVRDGGRGRLLIPVPFDPDDLSLLVAAVAAFPVNVIIIAALFCVLGLASSGTWLGFGAALQRVLKEPRAVRVFNIVMALLLVASLYPIFADTLH